MPRTTFHRTLNTLAALSLLAGTVMPAGASLAASPTRAHRPGPDDFDRTGTSAETGKVTFLGADPGDEVSLPSAPDGVMSFSRSSSSPENRARAFAGVYSSYFGVQDAAAELEMMRSDEGTAGGEVTRFQQVYEDIPVFGGELIVNVNDSGDLRSMSGEIAPDLDLSTSPAVSESEAKSKALASVARWEGVDSEVLVAESDGLWVFDERLLRPSDRQAELVWRIEVASTSGAPIDELVLVNAARGSISLHFNQIDTSWNPEHPGVNGPVGEPEQDEPTATPEAPPTEPPSAEPPTEEPTATETPTATEAPTTTETPAVTDTPTEPPPSETPTDTPTPEETPTPDGTVEALEDLDGPMAGVTWYVAVGGDDSADCLSPATPCETINAAIGKASADDTVRIAQGEYDSGGVVVIDKDLLLSGGWDATFENRTGLATLYYRVEVTPDVTASVEFADLFGDWNSSLLLNKGDLVLTDSTIRGGSYSHHVGELPGLIVNEGTLDLLRATITGNAVRNYDEASPIGILVNTGALSITDSTLNDNECMYGGSSGILNGGSLSVSNSTFDDNSCSYPGSVGGIYSTGGAVTITDSTFTHNSGSLGGGIYIGGGSLLVQGTHFERNHGDNYLAGGFRIGPLGQAIIEDSAFVDHWGGVFANDGTLELRRVDINSNVAEDGELVTNSGTLTAHELMIAQNYSEWSSYIHNSGTMSLVNCAVVENYTDGINGKAFVSTGSLDLDGCSFMGNHQTSITVEGGDLDITKSTFYGNQGASVVIAAGNGLLRNVTISGNFDYYHPGVVVRGSYPDTLLLENVTIADNTASRTGVGFYEDDDATSGGLLVQKATIPGTVLIRNSIVARNSNDLNPDCHGPITSGGYNVIGSNVGCSFSPASGDILGTGARPVFPFLGSVQDNGGPTWTQALLEGSPAIDAGNPDPPGTTEGACAATDQRGESRPSGDRCDIGAYEGVVLSGAFPHLMTFSAFNTWDLPGTLLCTSDQPACTDGQFPQADAAHHYASDTVEFYASHHDRPYLFDAEAPIVSTTSYGSGYQSAFWTGEQVVYGDGRSFSSADDIVAHELTHGVTDGGSRLFYYYQAGAINESFSDLWGEFVDQTNGSGNDSAEVKWQIGEDAVPGEPLRDMSDPASHEDPDRITSEYYYLGLEDNGGVHTNSAVNNKAVYLMTDGGTFRDHTIRGLGIDKVAAIYYEVQTHGLSSASDYGDLYHAVYQSCADLVGQHGITAADCLEVLEALQAVEMDEEPEPGFSPDAEACPSGATRFTTLFSDDFESGLGQWTTGALPVPLSEPDPNVWGLDAGWAGSYAHSGLHSLYADDTASGGNRGEQSDSFAAIADPVALPANAAAFLRFSHAYDTSAGVLEYSTDDGATWNDAGPLFSAGADYDTVNANPTNPLFGRATFRTSSHGYVMSRYELSPFGGASGRFRWRLASGQSWDGSRGWWVDDVEIYTCVYAPGVPALLSPASGATLSGARPSFDWSDAANAASYTLQVSPSSDFSSIYHEAMPSASDYTPPSDFASGTAYYWRVRTENAGGQQSAWSSARSFKTPISPPSLLSPTPGEILVSGDTLRPSLTWSPSAGATSYTLQVALNEGFSSGLTKVNTTSSTYAFTTALQPSKLYRWRVQAKGLVGTSAWSSVGTFTTGNPPSIPSPVAPANKALITGDASPDLDWTASTGAPSGYVAEYDDNPSFSSPDLCETTDSICLDVAAFDPAQSIYWRVYARRASGERSAYSSIRQFRIAYAPPTLDGPSDGSALDDRRPTLAWTASAGASGHSLQVSASPSMSSPVVAASLSGPTSTYALTKDLSSNKTYYWRVRADGAYGPSAWSEVWDFTTGNPPAIPALLAPADKALLPTTVASQPTMDWKDAAGADHYEIEVDDQNGGCFESVVDSGSPVPSQFTASAPLDPNTTYCWRVRAWSAAGHHSSWSPTRTFRTRIATPVLVGPLNGAELAGKRPSFDWDSVSGAGGYTLQVSLNSLMTSPVINATSTTSRYSALTDLLPDTQYFWRVQAKGKNGPSDWTAVSGFTTGNPPTVPTLAAPGNGALVPQDADTGDLTPLLDWFDSNGGGGVAGYRLEIAEDAAFASSSTQETSDSQFQVPAHLLASNRTQYWRVAAVATSGDTSAWSTTRTFRTAIDAPMLMLPTDDEVLHTRRPGIDWSDVAGAAGYVLQMSLNADCASPSTITTGGSAYAVTADLKANRTYYWRVQTKAANGPSAWTEVFSFTTGNPPPIPSLSSPGAAALLTDDTPTLRWSAVTGAVRYLVQVDDSSDFSSIISSGYSDGNVWEPSTSLLPAKTYYWHVASENLVGDTSPWSGTRTFRIAYAPPSLGTPRDGESVSTATPTFEWADTPGATSYTIQVSTGVTFTTLLVNQTVKASTLALTTPLPANTVLRWRVRVSGGYGPSLWSETRSLLIAP